MKVLRIFTAAGLAAAGIALLLYWAMIVGLYDAFASGPPPLSERSISATLFLWLTPLIGMALIFLCLRIGHGEAFQKFRRRKRSINEIEDAE